MNNLDQDEENRIVAVGLLTRREVAAVGMQLSRLYPIEDCSDFGELLEAIDDADREYHLQENKRPG